MKSQLSKTHLGEIKVCENPPQRNQRFRNSTAMKSKLANSTSVKSTFAKFHLGETRKNVLLLLYESAFRESAFRESAFRESALSQRKRSHSGEAPAGRGGL